MSWADAAMIILKYFRFCEYQYFVNSVGFK